MRMSDEEVERTFIRLRWQNNNGDPHCPHCGCSIVYACRRPGRAQRWRCKACQKDFSITSGTLFAFHKMPLRAYLLAVAAGTGCPFDAMRERPQPGHIHAGHGDAGQTAESERREQTVAQRHSEAGTAR
jgi:hypothetical protein